MPLKTFQDEQPTLNLTSMIDVVFLLIIFFMVGTQFTTRDHKLDLQVPSVAAADALTPAPTQREIEVDRDGNVVLDQESVTLDQLRSRLQTAHDQYPELAVIIRGDSHVDLQHVAAVLGVCRHVGISEMGLTVRLQQERAP